MTVGLAGAVLLAVVAGLLVRVDLAPSAGRSAVVPANGGSSSPALSANGRFVAFDSFASNLVAGDSNKVGDVFVRDRLTRKTTRVSVSSSGMQANGLSWDPAVSADGRFVAFTSDASNLVAGDTNGCNDVFVRDRLTRTTTRMSVGKRQRICGSEPSISADGRLVAFVFVTLPEQDSGVVVRDRATGGTSPVSVSSRGGRANGVTGFPAISANGRYVAFVSWASNLVVGDRDDRWADVFVHDRISRKTTKESVSRTGGPANDDSSDLSDPVLSANGRFVAFASDASNLVAADTTRTTDVFVRNRVTRTTTRVSVSSSGKQANFYSDDLAINADGRVVAFVSYASNLVVGDTNENEDVFVRDRLTRTTTRVSVSSRGTQANGLSGHPAISADGRIVAFESHASNLAGGARNDCIDVDDDEDCTDIFVRDRRTGATTLVSVGR